MSAETNGGATIEFVNATCCGALGCRNTEDLVRVTVSGYGTRVVCPTHRDDLLDREVGGR